MEERLDEHVDAVLSSRRTAEQPAMELSRLSREQQEFILHWVTATAQTHAEMAYQFAALARTAMEHMDAESVEAWIIQAMDAFDKKGLGAGITQLQKVEEFAQGRQQWTTGLALEDISGVLQHFIRGLNSRQLHLDAGEHTYTDTQTLFIPGLINRFTTREENFRLYKAIVVHLWAQTWYGTWRLDLARLTEKLPQRDRRIRIFHALETLRLDACIRRDLPGLYREMRDLRLALNPQPLAARWLVLRQRLQSAQANARTSWELVSSVYDDPIPKPCCYQGQLFPQRVREVSANRKNSEKEGFRIALAKLRDDLNAETEENPSYSPDEDKIPFAPFKLKRVESNDLPQGFVYELQLGERPAHPPDDVRGLMASIVQDLGEIPEDYLVPAGPGAYDGSACPQDLDPNDVWKGTYHEQGAFI